MKRSAPMGIAVRAAPTTTTTTVSTANPATAPMSVERHPRVAPTPTTMVTISIASTAEARKVVMRTTAVTFIRDSLPGFPEPGRADPQDALPQIETLIDDARESLAPCDRRLDSGWQ